MQEVTKPAIPAPAASVMATENENSINVTEHCRHVYDLPNAIQLLRPFVSIAKRFEEF
jgi:hypothetical protein